MKDLVSIIIPLKEEETFINETLESVKKQTYENIEILVVFENILLNEEKIVNYHVSIDKRIKTIKKKNKMIDNLKNLGIENAKGKYITIIESGDIVEKSFISDLYNIIKDNDADLVCSELYYKNEKPNFKKSKLEIFTEKELMEQYLNLKIRSHSTAKLYKKEIFKNITYPVSYYDDFLTTYKIFHESKKCVYVGIKAYKSLALNKKNIADKEHMKKINGCIDMLSFIETEYPDLIDFCKTKICFEAIDLLKKVKDKEYKKQLFEYIKLYRGYAINDLRIPMKIRSKAIKSILGLNMLDMYLKFEK